MFYGIQLWRSEDTMRVLTINVGLLDFTLCGACIVFSNPPYSAQRLPYLPEAILSCDADVVCIQECYSNAHVSFIYEQCKHKLPHMARQDSHKWGILNLHNGMVILSKFPIQKVYLLSHRQVACVENWFGDKSTLVAVLDVPELGPVHVINVHPTAGGMDPESETADRNRETTLREILDHYRHATQTLGHAAMIVGDLNCGPDASPKNFEYIMAGGFRDTFSEAIFEGRVANEHRHSWDSLNLLNHKGPHAHQQPQRIDHVLIPKADPRFGKVSHAEIVFTEKKVSVPAKDPTTGKKPALSSISDHYGVVVEIQLSANGEHGTLSPVGIATSAISVESR